MPANTLDRQNRLAPLITVIVAALAFTILLILVRLQWRPLESVDLATREPALAAYERSDICVVPAAGVIGEAMVALVLAQAFLEKFGGDSLAETKRNFESYLTQVRDF